MKYLAICVVNLFIVSAVLFCSCSKSHYDIQNVDTVNNNIVQEFEINTAREKTVAIDYDLKIQQGSLSILIRNSEMDTLLYQKHIRSLAGSYQIARTDTSHLSGQIIFKNYTGSYHITCKTL